MRAVPGGKVRIGGDVREPGITEQARAIASRFLSFPAAGRGPMFRPAAGLLMIALDRFSRSRDGQTTPRDADPKRRIRDTFRTPHATAHALMRSSSSVALIR
jgi:hypothetical protein